MFVYVCGLLQLLCLNNLILHIFKKCITISASKRIILNENKTLLKNVCKKKIDINMYILLKNLIKKRNTNSVIKII